MHSIFSHFERRQQSETNKKLNVSLVSTGYVKDYQQKLEPLSQSWKQPLQSVSTEKAGTSGIDTLDNKEDQVDEQPAKVAVPARNNWAITKGLIDSDSESEPEPDNIPNIENEGEQSQEENEHSGLLDDKAEAVDDYESGDSENEEDRQYRKENEVKHEGIDLGVCQDLYLSFLFFFDRLK